MKSDTTQLIGWMIYCTSILTGRLSLGFFALFFWLFSLWLVFKEIEMENLKDKINHAKYKVISIQLEMIHEKLSKKKRRK